MIVYQSTKNGFLQDVLSNEIDTKIHEAFFTHLGRHTSSSEVSSWKNSMMYMNNVLLDPDISSTAGISIEFQVPLTSKRVDFIITGLNELKEQQVIIIELKQWSNATLTIKDAIVKTWLHSSEVETAHPSYQAWSMERYSEPEVKSDTRIEFEVNEEVKYVDYLPLYSLKAACGAFGAWQVVEDAGCG